MSITIGDLNAAVRSLRAQGWLDLRDHCSLAELAAYRIGDLEPRARKEIADHLALCEDCTILLLYATDGLEPDADRSEPREDGVETQWERLRSHLDLGSAAWQPLDRLLDQGRPALQTALTLALEISRSLAHLHASGSVHSDLRAGNVLVGRSGTVRLLDSGAAPALIGLEVGYGRSAEAVLVELVAFQSPEQVTGKEPDRRANIFSLGALLYTLLTGRSPFAAETPLQTASRILSLDPEPARNLEPELPPAVSDLLQRLLEKEPAERPASAAAVLEMLSTIVEGGTAGREPDQLEGPPVLVDNLEDQIERLYREIAALVDEQIASNRPDDGEIERRYATLRELQAASARNFRARFEASLALPIDAGQAILERARTMRKELEDLAARDAAAGNADGS